MPRNFKYEWDLQRFRITSGIDKGKLIGKGEINLIQDRAISGTQNKIGNITARLYKEEITLKEWQELIIEEIKLLHLQAYSLGHGGWGYLTDYDYSVIEEKLDAEIEYFSDFVKEIESGELSQAQINARLNMYVEKFHSLRENARYEAHLKAGYNEEFRTRTVTDSCDLCIEYENAGVVDIGTLPNPGEKCYCLSNCRCFKTYMKTNKESLKLSGDLLSQIANKSLYIRFS